MSDKRKTPEENQVHAGYDGMDPPSAGDSSPCKGDGEGFHMDTWWEDRSLPEKILAGIGFGILGMGLLALCGLVVMLLWNWLMPEIFGLGRVDYWQAWGLLILSSILFKNFGFNDSGSGGSDRKRKKQLRRYMREGQISTGDDSAASSEA